MAQPVITRSQRRVERKQVVLILALVVVVAGASFALGVKFGQRGVDSPSLTEDIKKSKLPMAVKVEVPPPPVPEIVAEKPAQLTFYENLPKGGQAPLGSGINLPPEEKPVPSATQKSEVVKAKAKPTEPLLKAAPVPKPETHGAFLVQVASFRTSEDAQKLASRLKNHSLTTFVESADLGEKGVWHRVFAGPYGNRENADKVTRLLLEKERLSAIVKQR